MDKNNDHYDTYYNSSDEDVPAASIEEGNVYYESFSGKQRRATVTFLEISKM